MVRRAHGHLGVEGLEAVAEHSGDAIIVTDRAGVIEFVNAAFEVMTGYTRKEAVGRTPSLVKSGQHGAGFYRELWSAIAAGTVFRGIFLNRKKDGRLFREDEVISPFVDGEGRITHFVGAGRDASTRTRGLSQLAHLATHDSLTDLPNRGLFLDRLGQALKYALRQSEGFMLAIADVDRFKAINDTLGHVAGDTVLKAVAVRLQRCVRRVDTVARLGGDEFGIILVDVSDPDSARKGLEKMVAALAPPVMAEGHAVRASLSVGASLFPIDADNEPTLIRHADAAMYTAKRSGGDGYSLYGKPAPPQVEMQLSLWETSAEEYLGAIEASET